MPPKKKLKRNIMGLRNQKAPPIPEDRSQDTPPLPSAAESSTTDPKIEIAGSSPPNSDSPPLAKETSDGPGARASELDVEESDPNPHTEFDSVKPRWEEDTDDEHDAAEDADEPKVVENYSIWTGEEWQEVGSIPQGCTQNRSPPSPMLSRLQRNGLMLARRMRFMNRSWRFMSAYRKGLTGKAKAAAWAVRRYKGHRAVSQGPLMNLEALLSPESP